MTAESDLMRAVCERPFDDGPRLVYADWLDENGEPERAMWIRHQIANPNRRISVCFGDREVGQACPWDDGKEFCPGCSDMLDQGFPAQLLGEDTVYWRRGFVDSVSLSLRQLLGGECERCRGDGTRDLSHIEGGGWAECHRCSGSGRIPGLARALSRWPIVSVTLTDREPSRFTGAAMTALSRACVDLIRSLAEPPLPGMRWA